MNPARRVARRLAAIEAEHRVRILYACESGSRAWGFASRDSDFDVRFLYVHPLEWYLSVEDRRDVIEYPLEEDLDINGWEVRKALRLLKKSNPVLLEWLHSPIRYRQDEAFLDEMRALAVAFYSPSACFFHYLHMARGNRREYLRGPIVWLKKYLYVLRPLLACRWIEQGRGIPPVEFDRLVETVIEDGPLRQAIEVFLVRKRTGDELGEGPSIPILDDFLSRELDRMEEVAARLPRRERNDPAPLDRLLRRLVVEANQQQSG